MKHRKRVSWRWYAAVVWAACAMGLWWADAPWYLACPVLGVALVLFTWEVKITRRHL